MPRKLSLAFQTLFVRIPLLRIDNPRPLSWHERTDKKYRQIEASVQAIGLVEPLVVIKEVAGRFRLLDGRKRLHALQKLGARATHCLIATEDDCYTYNRRTNYLSPIAEHQMIAKALQTNSEETISKALGVSVRTILWKRDLLTGISQEVVDLLVSRRVPARAFATLRTLDHDHQMLVARMMLASNQTSNRFVRALAAASAELPRKPSSARVRPQTTLKETVDTLLGGLDELQLAFGREQLELNIWRYYLKRVLNSRTVCQFLGNKHAKALKTLRAVIVS